MNLRTLTERHATTFQKQLINLLYQPTWTILVKLGEINMIPLIILNKAQKFYHMVKYLWWLIKAMREKKMCSSLNIIFYSHNLFRFHKKHILFPQYIILNWIKSLWTCVLYIFKQSKLTSVYY